MFDDLSFNDLDNCADYWEWCQEIDKQDREEFDRDYDASDTYPWD